MAEELRINSSQEFRPIMGAFFQKMFITITESLKLLTKHCQNKKNNLEINIF